MTATAPVRVLVLDALAPDLTERTDLVGLIADRIASLQGAPA